MVQMTNTDSNVLEYNNLFEEIRGVMNPGRMKFQINGIFFKNSKTGKLDHFVPSDIGSLSWIEFANGPGLCIETTAGIFHRYSGFTKLDYDNVQNYLSKNYSLTLRDAHYTVKGHNWGLPIFEGSMLSFELPVSKEEYISYNRTTCFEIPLNYVSHCTTAKNELTMEFQQDDDAPISLVEMRFFVPSISGTTGGASDEQDDPVTTLHRKVMEKANVIQATGDAIATFSEAQCLTPRGRYDIKLYPTFAQLHGKTFDYKIAYTTILRLFVLPHKDHRQIFFVISLDPPIKQGQTRYPFLILLFEKDEEITMKLSLTEEEIKEKYDGKLTDVMTGKSFEVFSRLIKALSGNKITVPGSFKSHNGASSCISCSYKAGAGYLYPLERCFVFVHKPPLSIRFDEVASVNFARSSGPATKTFDFEVATKAGTEHTFSNIAKEEYTSLFDFIKTKNLVVRNIGGKLSNDTTNDYDMADDDIDDEILSEEEGEKRKRHKSSKTGNAAAAASAMDYEDGDSEEEDQDFAPPGGGSDESVAEEYDSNAESSINNSGDDSDGSATKKQKENKKSSAKKRSHSSTSDHTGSGENTQDDSQGEKDHIKGPTKSKNPNNNNHHHHKESKSIKAPPPNKKLATIITTGHKNKKDKKDRDPNMPKRPLTAYFLWLQENRESLKQKYPKASIVEITKLGGEEWRKITDKSKWEEASQRAKDAYNEAMKVYKASH